MKKLIDAVKRRWRVYKRHRRMYVLRLTNVSNRRVVWTLKMSRVRMWLLAAVLFLLVAGVSVLAVRLTPLRNVLPGGDAEDMRAKYVEMTIRADSLERIVGVNSGYLRNIQQVLNSEPTSTGNISLTQDDITVNIDSLMPASETERQFVEQYSEQEQFNLSVLSPIAADAMAFYSPVGAAVTVDASGGASSRGVSVTAGGLIPVSAVYRGTVIQNVYSPSAGYTITIQHPNEFITVYSGLVESFVVKGDKVSAGQRIGIANGEVRPMGFELWHSGLALSPLDYIAF